MRTTSWTTWRPLLLLSLGFLLSSISAKDGDTEASTKETKITPAPTTVAAGVDPTTATTATPAVASTSQAVVGSGPGATHTLAPSVNPDITTKASANVTLIALAPTTAKPTPPAVPSQSQTTQILVKMTPAPAIIQTTVPTAISPAIPSKPSTVVPASTAGKGATVVVSHHSETVTTPYPATPASTSGTSKTEASTTTVTKNIGTTQTPKVPTAAPLPTVKPSANTLSTTRASQGVTDRTTMIASQGQTTPGSTQPPVSIIVSGVPGVPGVPSTTTPPTTTIAGTSTAATLTIKAGVASGKPTTSITSLRSTPTSGVSKAITVRSTKTETQTLPDLAKKRFEYSLNKGQETEEDKTLVEICRRLLANMRDGKCTMTYEHRDGKLDFDMVEINGKVPDTLVEEYYEELNKKPTDNKTLIAILASCGALLIMIVILAVCASHHRKPYSENQQHLTEELPTVENGYHDNPTLDVMEAQPDMQEKKPALNGEFNDSWIVPLENMMKGDVPDEEDTHL